MEVLPEKSFEIFFSYAPQDKAMRDQLEKHLSTMQRQGLISSWYDSKVTAGEELEQEANRHLNKANIILLLISPDFMKSDYCYSVQMKRALERHEKKEAVVIPVLLRTVDLEDTPFKKLSALPSKTKFVTQWRRRDDAFADIAQGIRKVIKTLSSEGSVKQTRQVLYCENCKTPVSLLMPCWKCGLVSIQVCRECFTVNSIHRETCKICEAPLALVCKHCGTKNSFEADFCGNCGLQVQVDCPECGDRNFSDLEICQTCGTSLIQVCSHCEEKNSLEAELCARCGMPLMQVCITCDAFNEMDADTCWSCYNPLDRGYYVEIPLYLAPAFSHEHSNLV